MLKASVDWKAAWDSLTQQAWARVPEAVDDEAVRRLVDARHAPWKPLPREEGVVRQDGFGSYTSFADADVAVHELAARLAEWVERIATPRTPALPPFNEVTWTRYPVGSGHITKHRDPPTYTGLIVVTTLVGEAPFVACSDTGKQKEWLTSAGDIVLLTGQGWPGDTSRCPVHAVGAPTSTDRMILTLRSNARGAGAAYL